MQTTIKYKSRGRIEVRDLGARDIEFEVYGTPDQDETYARPTYVCKVKFWDHTGRERGMFTVLTFLEHATDKGYMLRCVADVYGVGNEGVFGYTHLPWDEE